MGYKSQCVCPSQSLSPLKLLDLLLFILQKSRPCLGGQLLSHLPHVGKWLQHLVTLPRIQFTSCFCGFKMADLEQYWKCESLHGSEKVHFSIPEVSLDVEEEENEIRYYTDPNEDNHAV